MNDFETHPVGTANRIADLESENERMSLERVGAMLAGQTYTYIGKDGRSVLARDLEDSRDEWKVRAEAAEARLAPVVALAAQIKADAEKATKGPWEFVETHPTNAVGTVKLADHFAEVATLYGPDDVGQRADGVWLDHPIRRATGRLIAAAPDMAAAILAAGGDA